MQLGPLVTHPPPLSPLHTDRLSEGCSKLTSFESFECLLPVHVPHWLPPAWAGEAEDRDLGLHLFSKDEVLG